jgi:hypothetical protein
MSGAEFDDEWYFRVTALPKITTLIVAGWQCENHHLSRLESLPTLRVVVLDSTRVTAKGVASLHSARPELIIHRSQRRAAERFGKKVQRIDDYLPSEWGDPRGIELSRAQSSVAGLMGAPYDDDFVIVSLHLGTAAVNADWPRYLETVDSVRQLVLPVRDLPADIFDRISHIPCLESLAVASIDKPCVLHRQLGRRVVFLQLHHLTLGSGVILDDLSASALIERFPSLETLVVVDGDLSNAGWRALGGLERLENLSIKNATDMDRTALTSTTCRALRNLTVNGTAFPVSAKR